MEDKIRREIQLKTNKSGSKHTSSKSKPEYKIEEDENSPKEDLNHSKHTEEIMQKYKHIVENKNKPAEKRQEVGRMGRMLFIQKGNTELPAKNTVSDAQLPNRSHFKSFYLKREIGPLSPKIPKSQTIYRTIKNQIIEFKDINGKLQQETNRIAREERDDFIFWIGVTQFCGKFEDEYWKLSLYSGENIIGRLKLKGHSEYDRFFLRQSTIYLSTEEEQLFKVQVKPEKLEAAEIKGIEGKVSSLVEMEDCLLVGTENCSVQRVREGESEILFEMNNSVIDLQIQGEYLLAIDYSGEALKYSLMDKEVKTKINFNLTGNHFLVENKLVIVTCRETTVFDWSKNKISKQKNSALDSMERIFQNGSESLLRSEKHVFVFSHKEMKLVSRTEATLLWCY